MKALKIVGGCFLATIVILSIFFFKNIFNNENPLEVQASPYAYQVNGPIEEHQLLERLKEDDSAAAIEKLIELKELRNATGYKANLILAEKLEAMGNDSTTYYERALDLHITKAVQLRLAKALVEQERHDEAIELYYKLLPAEEAIKALQQLNVDKWDIGWKLVDGQHLGDTYHYLEIDLGEYKDELEYKSLKAVLLASGQQYEDALSIFEEIREYIINDENVYWWYGRTLEAMGKLQGAIGVYEKLGNKGGYRLGIILEGMNQSLEAAKAYITSDLDVSLWRGARLLDDMNRRDEAFEIYKKIAYIEGSYREDAAYRAYILHKELKKSLDEEIIDLLMRSPAWAMAIGKEPIWQQLKETSYLEPQFLQAYEDYLEAGLGDMAALELSIGERLATNQEKLALGEGYLKQDLYYRAVIWGIRAIREEPTLEGYRLAYQKPYEEYVMAAAEEFQLDPYIIWAVMREESHYRADVFSRVGAVGLMQVMPATGKDIAARLKVDFQESHLLEPETNIRFGGFYIRSMLNSFDNDIDRALAAYNGGPGNVRRWSRTSLGATKEGFPTAISFLETRRYITKVKNSYYIYKWLYEE